MTKFRNLKTLNQVCFEQKAEVPINLYYWLIIKIFFSRIIFICTWSLTITILVQLSNVAIFRNYWIMGNLFTNVSPNTNNLNWYYIILCVTVQLFTVFSTNHKCLIVYIVFNQSQMFNCLPCFQPITNVQLFTVFQPITTVQLFTLTVF
jgi:hypothetical protein